VLILPLKAKQIPVPQEQFFIIMRFQKRFDQKNFEKERKYIQAVF
jgi:hypothetical protein